MPAPIRCAANTPPDAAGPVSRPNAGIVRRTVGGSDAGKSRLQTERGAMRIGPRRRVEHQRIRVANFIQPCRRAAPRHRLVIANPAPNAT
jgi:hypothetical protein